jgi:hypothetical protein
MAQGTSRSKNTAKSRTAKSAKSAKSRTAKSGNSGSARSSGGSRSKAATSRRTQSQARASSRKQSQARAPSRSAATRRRTNSNRSSNGKGALESVKETIGDSAKSAKETVTDGVQSTGDAVGTAAKKAKGPALAGGAALAGLAGGLAIAARAGGPRKVLGLPVPGTRRPLVKITTPRRVKRKGVSKDLLKAAGEVGSAGRQAGELAGEVQRVRADLDRGRRRSPIEVVLEGLTSRRVRG